MTDAIAFAIDHLDEIVRMPGGPRAVRSEILDAAVTGRLTVPGKPSSATVVDAGAKNADVFPAVLPQGWKVVPLGSIVSTITDGTHKTPTYVDNGVKFVSIKDISGGRLDLSRTRFISEREHEDLSRRVRPQKGDILICRIGTLGKPVVVDTSEPFSLFVSVGLLRPLTELVDPRYLALVLDSPRLYTIYDRVKAGGSHASKLNLGSFPELPVPLPPLDEQTAIADSVVAILDQLAQVSSDLQSVEAARERVAISASTRLIEGDAEDALEKVRLIVRTRADVVRLRSSILRLATLGRFSANRDLWPSSQIGDVVPISYGKGLDRALRKADGAYEAYGANGVIARTDEYLVETDGLVIGRKGSVGAVNRATGPFWPTDVSFYVQESDLSAFTLDYLELLLRAADLPSLGSGIKPGISRRQIEDLSVLVPPLSEQQRISDITRRLLSQLKEVEELLLE